MKEIAVHKIQWLHLTDAVDKFIIYVCEVP